MLNSARHPDLLDRTRSAVLVVDVQPAFATHVTEFARLVHDLAMLVEAARMLGVPVARSEQYPKGLGSTVPALLGALGEGSAVVQKLEFDVTAADGWVELPAEIRDARQFVVVGIEAHVCVRQTVLGLLRAGRDVHVPVDGVASRSLQHRDVALAGLARARAQVTTIEQVLFDWLAAAGTDEFRDVQSLLKAHSVDPA